MHEKPCLSYIKPNIYYWNLTFMFRFNVFWELFYFLEYFPDLFLNIFVIGVGNNQFLIFCLYLDILLFFLGNQNFLKRKRFGGVLGCCTQRIISSSNEDMLASSLPVCILFMVFSCFIAKALKSMWEEKTEIFFILDFMRKLGFSPIQYDL